MKTVIVALALIVSAPAFAANFTYSVNGKTVDAAQALQSSMKGATVMKCSEVVARPNEKGTSISLKAKKAE